MSVVFDQEGASILSCQQIEEGRVGRFGQRETLVAANDQGRVVSVRQHQPLALAGQEQDPQTPVEPEPVDAHPFRVTGGGDTRDVRPRGRARKTAQA
ncbi:hypothetical protein [uncultured Roseibium sp.]|uniref:hypothetical protein n=1 Tax=uncultured Roseibium sp. TaxID=1936171 RepID=UPI00374A8395